MAVLGLKVLGHDTGAALISNNKVVAIAEERLNRVKNSVGCFPELSINYCLETLSVEVDEVELIVIDRYVPDTKDIALNVKVFEEKMGSKFPNAKIVTANHHDAHVASAFFVSPYNDSAVLIYDGSGEVFEDHLGVVVTETDSLYKAENISFELIQKTAHVKRDFKFPYTTGIGKLYSIISKEYLNFGSFSEGKLMGLAGYGDDRVLKKYPMDKWFTERNGHILCNPKIVFRDLSISDKIKNKKNVFKFSKVLIDFTRSKIIYFLKKARDYVTYIGSGKAGSFVRPEIFDPIILDKPKRKEDEPLPDDYYASVAYAVQEVLEVVATRFGEKLKKITKSDNLCVAGGVGLNIDANRNFLDKVGFKNIFVQPAASDTGLALGCALYGYHVVLQKPRFFEMNSVSLGRVYTEEEILKAINKYKDKINVSKDTNVPETCAKHLSDKKIIGWFEGGSEYGPRALGNRSIICDARPEEMKDILNEKVKNREMWRPFATVILRDKLCEWFNMDYDSPFMLLDAEVLPSKVGMIPSVTHIDGTSRIQTVTEHYNGNYYKVVKEFEKLTGVPLLLNTSFNLAGEPIVETPEDAISTFLRTKMDYLVLENFILSKKD